LSDLTKLVVAMTNYMSKTSFTNRLLRLEGKKVFGFVKQPVDYPPRAKNDSHHFNYVSLSLPWVTVPTIVPNNVEDVLMQHPPSSSNNLVPLVFWNGLKFRENVCVDGQWCIECCPPNFAIQCSTLQKTIRFKCKAMINFYKSINGILIPSCLGFWVQYHSRSFKHHKHWFCHDDFCHYVGGTTWKFAIVRPIIELYDPSMKVLT